MSAVQTRTLVSLFTGAGGLDLGLEAAGFHPQLCVENDESARSTLTENRPQWPISEPGDIHNLGAEGLRRQAGLRAGQLDLLAGGPPCQPFSKSAFWHRGETARLQDPRADTLLAYLQIVATLRPRVLLIENVTGIGFREKNEGLLAIEHDLRQINATVGTAYDPVMLRINTADFGVPQSRERVFVIAERSGRRIELAPTHGDSGYQPHTTAWDAIGHLPSPRDADRLHLRGKWADLLPTIPEGHNYLWHTRRGGGVPLFGWRTRYWSFLLKLAKARPAWTIQAAPGPATGPFHWDNRMLSIRELCRLQTFPDDFMIMGDRRVAHRQIGNAVPCLMGEILGREIRLQLLDSPVRTSLRFTVEHRSDCPRPADIQPLPTRFRNRRQINSDHPGEGLGPGASRRV